MIVALEQEVLRLKQREETLNGHLAEREEVGPIYTCTQYAHTKNFTPITGLDESNSRAAG